MLHSGSSIKNAAPIWPSAKSPAIAAAMEIYLTQPPLRIILVMGTISIITAVTVLRLIKHEVEFISMEQPFYSLKAPGWLKVIILMKRTIWSCRRQNGCNSFR